MDDLKVYLYNFSGNYDCDSCGRVNCEFAVVVTRNVMGASNYVQEYCDRCIWELVPDEELEAYIEARRRIVDNHPPRNGEPS